MTSACFAQALSITSAEKIQRIAALTDEEIKESGLIILSDLRGHLQHEAALLGLHERKEFVFSQLPPEEYGDPVQEAFDLSQKPPVSEEDEDQDAIEALSTPPPIVKPLRKKPKTSKKKKKR